MNRKPTIIAALLLLSLCISSNAQRPGSWMELPAMSRKEARDAYAVEMTISGQRQRNYTFYWNESRMTADWVAYPLCSGNIGTGKRTNSFGLCPLLPLAELERHTGLEYFPALKILLGKERYLEIKAEDPAQQSCWGN